MKIIMYLYFLFLKLRYKFIIFGLEKVEKNKQYVIFPNHQALVDPQIVVSLLGTKINISPIISETYYNIPVLKTFFKLMGAVSMPDIQRGTGDKEGIKESLKSINLGIKNKKNILLYPAGQLYSQGYEVIKGKKTAFNLVQTLPDNVEILIIKTTGLWGSMWSKAWEGDTPNFFKTFVKAIIILIGNIFFITPKREVKVEIENYTKVLKNIKDINHFNQILEEFYNKDGEENIRYVKHYFYYNNVKNKMPPKVIKGSQAFLSDTRKIDENIISDDVKEKIISKISEMKDIKKELINIKSILIRDLYFDSLDMSEIKSFVQTNFNGSSNPPITELKSVGDLYLMAIGQLDSTEELKVCDWVLENEPEKTLYEIILKNKDKLGDNANILNLFKESFKKNKKDSFVYDTIFGLQSKKDFLIKAYLVSSYIKKIEGKYIGIMLPSVSSASLIILSTYLAGKIPVMLNWTLGEASLLHCVKFVKINNVLTSKNFYEKVQNDGTEKIKDKYIFLEDMLKDIKLITKLKALFNSIIFNIPKIKLSDTAVILFTSGSESMPKAVSLTHKNIISDILGALYHFSIQKKDILIGFLPPFHSFGFSINTIMPLISGLRVAYSPDPNDSKTLINLIKHCKVTTLTSTPTFLKMILSVSESEDLKILKYAVVGAEKCPESLVENFNKFCPDGKILEGYGITECSPVISINPPDKPKMGSVGLPIFGSEVKIVSLNNKKELEKNKEGMIYFRGYNVFSGYLDEKLENPFDEIDGKVYYKTGDLGYLDDEGYLYITGRLKRFVKIAGEMVSLPFIEGILNKKYGSDTENKLAIEAKEKDGNVKIVLFGIEDLDLEEVSDYLRQNGVSNLVKISEFIQINSIPVLGTGKTDYKILKEMISF